MVPTQVADLTSRSQHRRRAAGFADVGAALLLWRMVTDSRQASVVQPASTIADVRPGQSEANSDGLAPLFASPRAARRTPDNSLMQNRPGAKTRCSRQLA